MLGLIFRSLPGQSIRPDRVLLSAGCFSSVNPQKMVLLDLSSVNNRMFETGEWALGNKIPLFFFFFFSSFFSLLLLLLRNRVAPSPSRSSSFRCGHRGGARRAGAPDRPLHAQGHRVRFPGHRGTAQARGAVGSAPGQDSRPTEQQHWYIAHKHAAMNILTDLGRFDAYLT